MIIVLVHGIFNNRKLFNTLIKQLEQQGHRCYVPLLQPIDGRKGINDLALKLRQCIDIQLGATQPIVLIGFSMGGIVSRYYLQQLNGYQRTLAFFSLAAPHQGTWTAYLYPGQGTKDIRQGSSLLLMLSQTENVYYKMLVISYRTVFDLMILPSSSSHWPIAINKKTFDLLHRCLPSNPFVCANIVQHINALTLTEKANHTP